MRNVKVAFLTNKSSHGAAMLARMKHEGIPIEAIFLEQRKTSKTGREALGALRRLGPITFSKVVLSKFIIEPLKLNREKWHYNDFYSQYSDKVIVVENFNDETCAERMKRVAPDVVVLGGSRILRQHIIEIPTLGVLNAHPGLLPKYRGVDVIPWAILNGDDIGVTLHFIDKGVDTGPVVFTEVLDNQNDDSLESLKKRAELLAAELMCKAIRILRDHGTLPVAHQSTESGQQYYKMPSHLLDKVNSKLLGR